MSSVHARARIDLQVEAAQRHQGGTDALTYTVRRAVERQVELSSYSRSCRRTPLQPAPLTVTSASSHTARRRQTA